MEAESLSVREADYLIALYLAGRGDGVVRAKDIASMLGVAKPTVSLMLKKLLRLGLVVKVRPGYKLTDEGLRLAREIVWRHGVVEEALSRLGLSKDEACCVARLIELNIPLSSLMTIWVNLGCPKKCPHGISIELVNGEPVTCRRLGRH